MVRLAVLMVDQSRRSYAAARRRRWNRHDIVAARDRTVDSRDEVLEGFALFVTRRDGVERTIALLVAVMGKLFMNICHKLLIINYSLLLIKRHRESLCSAGVDRWRSHEIRQIRAAHDSLVGDRPEPRHVRLSIHSHSEQSALERVDNNQNITELGWQDIASVVATVLAPNDVHLVVAQVPGLVKYCFMCIGWNACRNVENNFEEWRRVVRRGLAASLTRQAAEKTVVSLQLNLPAESRHEHLVGAAARRVSVMEMKR